MRWQAPELLGCGLECIDDERPAPNTRSSDLYAFACVCYEVRYVSMICRHPIHDIVVSYFLASFRSTNSETALL